MPGRWTQRTIHAAQDGTFHQRAAHDGPRDCPPPDNHRPIPLSLRRRAAATWPYLQQPWLNPRYCARGRALHAPWTKVLLLNPPTQPATWTPSRTLADNEAHWGGSVPRPLPRIQKSLGNYLVGGIWRVLSSPAPYLLLPSSSPVLGPVIPNLVFVSIKKQ
jgi:hypothetical protein